MRLVIVGTGYVGLVTGACFAGAGHDVICIDNDQLKVKRLQRGELPIFEPGLDELVRANSGAGRLSFSDNLAAAARKADAVFIAVGTPSRECDGHADLTFVFKVAREMATSLRNGAIVAVKSTVPVGTGDEVERIIGEIRGDSLVSVVSNPEFLRAGSAIRDFMEPDRIVVGAQDERARKVMRDIYEVLPTKCPLVFTGRRSSELIKYGANTLLATKIAFINEIADLCERSGADVQEVALAIGLDRRIGPNFLQAGPGFGGSCFRKDATALAKMGEDHQIWMRMTEAVVASNEYRKALLMRKVASAIGQTLRRKTIGVWGVTFKPNTDDIRESPAIPLIIALLDAGARVQLYDPQGLAAARSLWQDSVHMAPDAYAAARGADALVIMTEWEEFKNADLVRLGDVMGDRIVVDNRNVFQPSEMERLGFAYHSVGRAAVDRAEVPKLLPQPVIPRSKKARVLASPALRRNPEVTGVRSGGHAPAQTAARASSAD